ncbi:MULTISPECIES: hypothetical protein [unclassified Sphingomonas]|uniref:hypothetical protein n=1 Tax=unclassified Sphingomonas TaxID=196159 RepID=UPI002151F1C6|nr:MULTISPECIES: hypothetical protein [unclassified Sphingomonas]MCR5872131.1 hypothetical protein [Sphingomonas sp. J344]UUX99561.1 hypothetical protein LRS08_19420 [Sphingomonas sp. J315]
MRRVTYLGGVARAVLAAGPIFVLAVTFGSLLVDPGAFDPIWLFTIIPVLMMSIAIGMLISAVPIVVGGAAMAFAGVKWPRTRGREIWAGAGAMLGMALVLPLDIPGTPSSWEHYALMAFTGGICALIVRRGTYWSVDNA